MKYKRFTWTEISYHWAYAITFLPLLFTGTIMIFQKMLLVEIVSKETLVSMHKYTGIAFILLPFLVALGGDWRIHLTNLIECLTWKKNDFIWMKKMTFRQKDLPEVSKFNPGQKVNMLLSIFNYFVFAITGIIIWFQKGALSAWYIHIIFFVGAIPMLAGHLFLATINRSTRGGLPGIFHGKVPKEYIEHHHSLVLKEQRPLFSFKGTWRLLLLIPIVIFVPQFMYYFFQIQGVEKNVAKIVSFNETFVMPGELIKSHQIEETKNCYVCHDLGGKISEQKCFACHEEIKRRMDGKIGFHGKVDKECILCHSEHHGADFVTIPLNDKEFNHNQALFSLNGSHRKLTCNKCHQDKKEQRLKYLDLKFSHCSDCHEDPHQKQFSDACSKCHTEDNWKGESLLFKHNKNSLFLLVGKHFETKCEECHKKENNVTQYKKIEHQKCSDCHENPHQQKLGNACTDCHNENGFHEPFVTFSHQKSSFPLKGEHKEISCDKCHSKMIAAKTHKEYTSYKNIAHQKCTDCHKNPHGVNLKNTCTDCHSEKGWKGGFLAFDHQVSKFPLKGKHLEVNCNKCHKNIQHNGDDIVNYKPSVSCTACHDDVHKQQFKEKNCTDCHSESGWKNKHLKFNHDKNSLFALRGKHSQVKCEECHKKNNNVIPFKNIRSENCTNCHEDIHQGISKNCTDCHSEKGWKGENLSFNHNDTRFPLKFDHKDVSCKDCHKQQNIFHVKDTSCVQCHEQYQEMLAGTYMAKQPVPDYHNGIVSCSKCHDDSIKKSTSDPEKMCSSCHSAHYEQLYFNHKILVNDALREAESQSRRDFVNKAKKIGAHNFLLLKKLINNDK